MYYHRGRFTQAENAAWKIRRAHYIRDYILKINGLEEELWGKADTDCARMSFREVAHYYNFLRAKKAES